MPQSEGCRGERRAPHTNTHRRLERGVGSGREHHTEQDRGQEEGESKDTGRVGSREWTGHVRSKDGHVGRAIGTENKRID